MNIKPMADRVLIKRIVEDQVSPGGIIIPDNAKEKPSKGTIVAVGTGKRNRDGNVTPLSVVPGDVVLFGRHSGTVLKHEGQEYLIMKEEEILSMFVGE